MRQEGGVKCLRCEVTDSAKTYPQRCHSCADMAKDYLPLQKIKSDLTSVLVSSVCVSNMVCGYEMICDDLR